MFEFASRYGQRYDSSAKRKLCPQTISGLRSDTPYICRPGIVCEGKEFHCEGEESDCEGHAWIFNVHQFVLLGYRIPLSCMSYT